MGNRLALRYTIQGDLRFMSHHDSLRLLERALARGGVPIRYSQGFNPRPRMRIALPRSVGIASLDELLVVELTSEASEAACSDVQSWLLPVMPPGIEIVSVEVLCKGDRRLPCEAGYALEIEPTMAEAVGRRAATFLSKDRVEIDRHVPKTRSRRTIDIRQYILTMQVNGDCLRWTQSITSTGTARPDEVLSALGLSPGDHLHHLCRERVWYSP
ncbi:MAG: DUF2344 domain-containing protein [Phycisphaerae bacterium]|nr:DUF2344 domain-containing protein [Phycisphaerae bacterium]